MCHPMVVVLSVAQAYPDHLIHAKCPNPGRGVPFLSAIRQVPAQPRQLPALILMSAQIVSTQSDKFVILQDSPRQIAMWAEAMAQWQRVGFQTQRLGVRIPLASHLFFGFLMYDDTLKIKTKCRNWESHPGCRGHNAESCY